MGVLTFPVLQADQLGYEVLQVIDALLDCGLQGNHPRFFGAAGQGVQIADGLYGLRTQECNCGNGKAAISGKLLQSEGPRPAVGHVLPHLGQQQERAAGTGVRVLLPQVEELG